MVVTVYKNIVPYSVVYLCSRLVIFFHFPSILSIDIGSMDDCVEGEVRLQDGTDPSNGRVEVCQNGIWGSVCTNQWDHNDARVVCKQLGYDPEGSFLVVIL